MDDLYPSQEKRAPLTNVGDKDGVCCILFFKSCHYLMDILILSVHSAIFRLNQTTNNINDGKDKIFYLWVGYPNILAHSQFCSGLRGRFFGGCCSSLGSQRNGTILGSLILAESFTKRRLVAEVEVVSQILDGKVPPNASMASC